MQFPVYKYKQSSVFASRVERGESKGKKSRPTTAVHTNASTRKLYSANSMKEFHEDLDETYESDGVTPGPGYYLDNSKVTCFKKNEIPKKMQFFGSTVDRFEEKDGENKVVGPGAYFAEEGMRP